MTARMTFKDAAGEAWLESIRVPGRTFYVVEIPASDGCFDWGCHEYVGNMYEDYEALVHVSYRHLED
jgi:hypothetical protein